jgi:hypothetical protein
MSAFISVVVLFCENKGICTLTPIQGILSVVKMIPRYTRRINSPLQRPQAYFMTPEEDISRQ